MHMIFFQNCLVDLFLLEDAGCTVSFRDTSLQVVYPSGQMKPGVCHEPPGGGSTLAKNGMLPNFLFEALGPGGLFLGPEAGAREGAATCSCRRRQDCVVGCAFMLCFDAVLWVVLICGMKTLGPDCAGLASMC